MESVIDPRMQYVLVGDQVFIRRSKRQAYQKAEVVSVTPKHGFVNVEWRDTEGNLWGREVTIHDVLDLNPSLVANRIPQTPCNMSSASVISFHPLFHQDSVQVTDQFNRPTTSPKENMVDEKWLQDMQERLKDARMRATTLPKNAYLHQKGCHNSGTDKDDDDTNNAAEGSRVSSRSLIDGGVFSNQETVSPNKAGNPSGEQLQPQEHNHNTQGHLSNNQSSTNQAESIDNPFYSPLMEEMYAEQVQVVKNHSAVAVPQNRNSCMNNNKTCSFHSENTCTKNKGAPKRSMENNNFKPATLLHSLPKCKNKDTDRACRRASTSHTSHVTKSSCVARRQPAVSSPQVKHTSDRCLPAPSPHSKNKCQVVDNVQRMERDRELRRRKQEERRAIEHELRMKDPGNVNWKLNLMVQDYKARVSYDPLQITDPVKQSRIIVCIRKRPLNAKEIERKEIDIITIPNKDKIVVHEPRTKLDMTKYLTHHPFRFDYAFDENSTNDLVYHFTTKPLIKTFFEGGRATVFAYGQTGSGKTHTMGGTFVGTKQDSNNGIYMNIARDVFNVLADHGGDFGEGLRLTVSFFEIYKGKLFDLLAEKHEIKVMEDVEQQIQVVGLTELYVDSLVEVVSMIRKGNAVRTSGKTTINPMSSRSHSVFQLILRQDSGELGKDKGPIYSKFSLIDLAGNERGVGKGAVVDRQVEIEGAEINKSLLALKECIRALQRNESHIPFRGSKLTLVLKDTFMNVNSRVCMIGTVSPGHSSCNCSMNTLIYANRVKEFVANDPSMEDVDNNEKQ